MAASVTLLENPLFTSYCFYASVLLLKTMLMSIFTSSQRIKYNAYVNPEDAKKNNVHPRSDDNVERVRRAHLNDLENILTFLFIAVIYILTNPSPRLASFLFFTFTVLRIIHTIVYSIIVVPQPTRGVVWLVAYIISLYMAVASILHFAF